MLDAAPGKIAPTAAMARFPWLEQPDVLATTILRFYRNVIATD
jgi:hypothetical protein